jgi:ferredoxin
MSRVHVDDAVCEGTGFCAALAPAIFEVGPQGARATEGELTGEARALALEAAQMCPTRAIAVEE